MTSARRLVVLDGSPIPSGSVSRLLAEVGAGAVAAGGRVTGFRCYDLHVAPCQSCGPEPTTGFCVLHDDMDPVYEALRDAHAVVVGSPVYFDTVSAPLKLVMDRCNCITPLVHLEGGGYGFRPLWARSRPAAFITACAAGQRHDLAERSVRGFLKWIGAKWQETIFYEHAGNDPGSVLGHAELLARARALGRELIEQEPLGGE